MIHSGHIHAPIPVHGSVQIFNHPAPQHGHGNNQHIHAPFPHHGVLALDAHHHHGHGHHHHGHHHHGHHHHGHGHHHHGHHHHGHGHHGHGNPINQCTPQQNQGMTPESFSPDLEQV